MLNSTITQSFKHKLAFVQDLGIDKSIDRDDSHKEIFLTAFVHKSYASDFVPTLSHNERLEFLGDSILWACISSLLYTSHTDREESQMTLYKIALVREETLAQVARDISLGEQLFLSHGEENQGGRDKDAILADGLEALIGAIYLLFGYKYAYYFIDKYVGVYLDHVIQDGGKSHKSRIQERAQGLWYGLPRYSTQPLAKQASEGFKADIYIDDTHYGSWIGKNKKKAQEAAAQDALSKIEQEKL